MTQRVEITDNRQLTTGNSHCEAMRLLVGLGNPGRQYDGTRHNIGFATVDALARQHQVEFSFSSKWNADVAKISHEGSGDLWLMKPRTLMNLSGTAVASFAHFFRLTPAEILIVLDDVMLPLGTIRLRSSGSAGGQRGLESVLMHFSKEAVPRLRLGIGAIAEEDSDEGKIKSTQIALSDYVLARFESKELPLVQAAVQRAVEALEMIRQQDFKTAMNKFNASN
ncbi:MAG: aminoacyl-tRNA hydrolase [Verrucomicrobiae bacterium]|nr:aminoacyl-tRNA hydrolase [Verrucomicrobiae bacterium]